jgi:predicted nucleotidyltransferase
MEEDSFALTAAERGVLAALNRHGIRYMLVGLGAAALQGANTATEDIDIWFEDIADPRIGDAINGIGGVWISGSFGMTQPQIGGSAIGNRLDVVTHMSGLGKFSEETANTTQVELDGLPVLVLKLERIIASKRAAGRKKDLAVIPALEEALEALRR